MSDQRNLWDEGTGAERKRAAKAHHEVRYAPLLARLRAALALCATHGRPVTSDIAQELLDAWGYDGNRCFLGALFRSPEWEMTGEWRPSSRPLNHARYVRVWRHRGSP